VSTHRKEKRLFLGALRTSPWIRGPILLLRHPVVFLSIVAATAVLAIAASSGVLFVSTLDTAALEHQAKGDCAERSMPGFSADIPTNALPEGRAQLLKAMSAHHPLGKPYTVELGYATVGATPVNFYSRDGALEHVTPLPDAGGSGAWIPDNFVTQWHVKPGDSLTTVAGRSFRVAGVYKSLSPSPFALADVPDYFCNWQDLIIRRLVENGTGPLVLVDESTMAAAADDKSQVSVFDPIPYGSTTVEAAEQANRRSDDAQREFFSYTAIGESPELKAPNSTAPIATSESLDHKIALARQTRAGVSGSVLPIDIAGAVVASLLVAGAGAYWATSRSREIKLLVSRGVTPAALSVKAVLETAPAVLIGTAAGVFASTALVRGVGPASVFEPGTMKSAGWAAVAATVVGLLLIAAIGAVASRDRLIGGRRRWHSVAPWELVLVGVAAVLAWRIRSDNGVRIDNAIVHISPTMVIFPLIGSLAALLLLGRIVGIFLSWIRRHTTRGGTAFYLALRRITGSRAIAVGLLVCVALPGALLTYTSTITASVKHEVTAKYRTNVGAPRVLTAIGIRQDDPQLNWIGTAVAVYQATGAFPDDTQVSVLGIDPATFNDFALVDSGQRHAVTKLHRVPAGEPAPALLVNAPSGQKATSLRIGKSEFPLHVVGRSAVFPGLHVGAFPLVVVDRSTLSNIDTNVSRTNQVWTNDANDAAVGTLLTQKGYSVLNEVTPALVVGTTGLLPLTWIFDYLKALAIMIGMVAIAGLVFSLAARMRRRTVSYVLSRRMGLTRFGHVRSLLVELTLVVGLGFAAGVGVGSAAFRVILDSLDVYPSLPPPASFEPPRSTWAVTGLVWVGVIIIATVSLQVLADRARPADILRIE
jgi:putative ABC transport system permease protein